VLPAAIVEGEAVGSDGGCGLGTSGQGDLVTGLRQLAARQTPDGARANYQYVQTRSLLDANMGV